GRSARPSGGRYPRRFPQSPGWLPARSPTARRPPDRPPRTRRARAAGESRAVSRHCAWPPAASPAEHRPLGTEQLVDPLPRKIQQQVELGAGEAVVLARALDLDEASRL